MSGEPSNAPGSVLVIGYGNPLRGDDGAGHRVAEAVAAWGLPHVQAVAVHQLTPELVELLAPARLLVFVDAYPAAEGGAVVVEPVEPDERPPLLEHAHDPRWLLALGKAVHGSFPQSWWLMVPGVRFELSDTLSSTAASGIDAALQQIAFLVRPTISCRL
jgi:hydrogenase maturation protease